MRHTPRNVAVVLLAGLALTGAACSRPGDTASTPTASDNKSAVLIMSTLNNPFFVSVQQGAEAEAAKLGITLDVQNANNSDATALNLASTAVLKKPGILILDPVGSQSGTAGVTAANQAGVPVMAFDRRPEGGNLATFVGYDAIQAGRNAADALAKGLGGQGKVVNIQGILGTNVAQDRDKGFTEEIAKHPGITVTATQPANFDRAEALDVMTNVLQAHPDVNGVYAANDEMAMGVLAALKAANLATKVTLVGNDGIADSLAAVAAGEMYATNAESPYALGQRVMNLAADVLDGKAVDKNTVLEGQLVTKDDIAAYAQHLTSIGAAADVPPSLK